jgi:hypothetical protein
VATALDQRAVRRRYNTAALLRQRRFKPYVQPSTAPQGTFDPTLAAQGRASQRGLGDLQADTGIQDIRSSDDLQRALNQAGQNRDTSLSTLLREGQRVDQNYATDRTDRQRSYTNLAASQADRANAAGILGGGYDAQAAQNRGVNQSREQGVADLGHQRYTEDYSAQQKAINQNYDRTAGELNLAAGRAQEDRANTLSRATREAGFFGQDLNEAELYQSKAAGLLPTPPPDERTRQGLTYRQLPGGQGAVLQSGRAISQSQLVRMLRRRGWKPK